MIRTFKTRHSGGIEVTGMQNAPNGTSCQQNDWTTELPLLWTLLIRVAACSAVNQLKLDLIVSSW